ncbi:NAD(P)-dependent oxidoreductase [Allopusillimonas ginsengisoli]|uniref:NAD(P)-dependent oxidoreductase n=1 Tax=Allopusillimonas ginsengisoli TaxID=453575 RepID=UPI00101F4481|nr:NAD(P)-dependent oxidoreductase [Allopusillimonas ginsengisoli]TEA79621.1 NAD(P)-dependent oxidoreductase [Allopusillimonas ginsengisoli]
MTQQKLTVGMIGVGLMGHGIASNIARHGHRLIILEHAGNQPINDLLAAGANVVSSPAAVAQASDVVILCLTGSPQVEAVAGDAGGLLEGMHPGLLIVDCSTALPSSTLKVAQSIEAAGGRYIDAPMTRTPKEAAQGRLNLIVGGDAQILETVSPLLRCFAESIVHAGPVGAGHQMKLIHNFVSLGFSAVLAEAAACAQKAGINPDTMVDILATGGGGGVVLDRLKPYITGKDESGMRFSLANAVKDMTYYTTMAEEMGASHVTAQAVRASFEFGVHARSPDATVPTLIDILANARAGEKS